MIICAYTDERWDQFLAAVRSVDRQIRPPLEVVVAVDKNPDLMTRVRESLPNVVVTENRETSGLSGTRNAGIAAASGEVLAFLDDDAEAAPDWLERLLRPYSDPTVLGVGGLIEPRWECGRPRSLPPEFDWVVGCSYHGLPRVASPVRNLIGANMSLRRDVFTRVGGFSCEVGRVGKLPAGCEETELCIRVLQAFKAGILLYEPAARVAHAVPAARSTSHYFRRRCFAEGVSKARVSNLVGSARGLSSERAYVARALPAGVLRGVRDTLRGDRWGTARAAAIVAGLVFTVSGYIVGRVRGRAGLMLDGPSADREQVRVPSGTRS